MRVGTICFATERGLGYLAKSFYDNGIVTDVAVLQHGRIPTFTEWYPDCIHITTKPWINDRVKKMIEEVDVMLYFETPFEWEALRYARRVGTKSVLMPMYECGYERAKMPYIPDFFVCPSILDLDIYGPENCEFIPVPVDVPWTQRTTAKRFVHNSGHIGLRGRNGTLELLQAMEHVKSPIELTVRCQDARGFMRLLQQVPKVQQDTRVKFEGHVPYDDLYRGFDVSIAPEKFNGLSLPLQEAHAQGLLVVSTDRYPANTWLPKEPLIPVEKTVQSRVAGRFMEFEECVLDPRLIAQTIDEWYGKDITWFSNAGREWVYHTSWSKLKPRYVEALESCL